ncbi:hypothetical protein [Sphingomonas abietis]|uniref:Uncharacterized protein n=1 Tax=Sphingomonas abietis TaxID=3012344 RepID=A0ABY7NRL5_9SPHN|nr:hypothetical protein [Sphingomonas abietis]WBO23445.1 hypothetical protein PBT88_04760 [Sphingomonas abietis]
MSQASRALSRRTLSAPSLSATLVRRRRPLRLAPPAAYATMPALPAIPVDDAPRWTNWREDVRFFLACYAAGFAFFLIMLS